MVPRRFEMRAIGHLLTCLKVPSGRDVKTANTDLLDALMPKQACIDEETQEPPMPSDSDLARSVAAIGGLFREARALCNMSPQRAAYALGIRLARLELIESCRRRPALNLIHKAARLYDVSVDFLFGLTTDWQRVGDGLEDREVFG